MKPSPKRQPAKPRKLRGKYVGGIYLSARFRNWCRDRHLRPEFVAGCAADMLATDHPSAPAFIRSDYPLDPARAYDADWLKSQNL